MSARPVTLVSGAASGIGRHMAISLANAGHALVLSDVNATGLSELVTEQRWTDSEHIVTQTLDVRDTAGWEALVDNTVQRFGRIDSMLNIAGFLRPGNITDIDADTIDRHIDINVKGVMYATRVGARQMIKQRAGHILNVASIAGVSHVPGMAAYCASKHAVRGFTLSVAHELRAHDVDVTVFCPDAVETPMLKAQEAHPEAAMTFGAGRGLSLQEVEKAMLRAMKERPLEVLLDVPRSGRAVGAKLANTFPRLTGLALSRIRADGERVQQRRLRNP
jgi:3-oxoacyl-[acyl-carrier protein] reductase